MTRDARPAPAAVALFCSDIREEVGGTFSLIGILPNNMKVAGFPGFITKLAIHIRQTFPLDQIPETISSTIEFPWGLSETIGTMTAKDINQFVPEARNSGNKSLTIISNSIFSAFELREAGEMKVICTADGKDTLAGFLNIVGPS